MIMSMIYDHSRSMLAIPFPLPYREAMVAVRQSVSN